MPASYHHGSLREALVAEGRRQLEEEGAHAISLRGLAKRIGVSHSAPVRHFGSRDELIDELLRANFRGVFATIRAFAPLLKRGGDSVIINISSLAAITGSGSSIIYGASKAALDTMGMSLARVLGPEIRVLSISPSAVATDFVPGRSRAAVEKAAGASPLQTVTEADDVALTIMAAITHLRLTTGSIILVDGGKHL